MSSIVKVFQYSSLYPLASGAPQGSILDPLIFTIFFKDFAENIKHSKLSKCADDAVIYVASKDVSMIKNEKLTVHLKLLAHWFDTNKVMIIF